MVEPCSAIQKGERVIPGKWVPLEVVMLNEMNQTHELKLRMASLT